MDVFYRLGHLRKRVFNQTKITFIDKYLMNHFHSFCGRIMDRKCFLFLEWKGGLNNLMENIFLLVNIIMKKIKIKSHYKQPQYKNGHHFINMKDVVISDPPISCSPYLFNIYIILKTLRTQGDVQFIRYDNFFTCPTSCQKHKLRVVY